jgi:beta-methylarginine biosynthesis bifunctional aminotransferase
MNEFVHQRGHISVLQQRILFAESHFSEPAYLVENFPEWPPHAFEEATYLPSARSASQYLPSGGSAELVERIIAHEREKYGVALAEETVLVTAGGMHALWLAFRDIATRRPGSTVLCLGITFVGVVNLIGMAGMKVRFVNRNPADLTLEDVERHLTADVSCLYVNSPHNPTGEYIDRQMMRRLTQLVEARSLSCVIDAVYDSYFFDGGSPELPAGIGVADHLYFVCSMSKNFGLPGARIGWLVSSARNVRTAIFWLENENVSVSSVSQDLAARVLAFGNRPLMASMVMVRARVLDFLSREFGLRRLPPAGTQMALKLPVSDVEHFADYALNQHELVLATSSNYAGFREGFIRLPFSYLLDRTERALQRLELAINTYNEARPASASAS